MNWRFALAFIGWMAVAVAVGVVAGEVTGGGHVVVFFTSMIVSAAGNTFIFGRLWRWPT